jgi:DNA (cytosine-5)-methyltransferase 1
MGTPDSYVLSKNTGEAVSFLGDRVAPPVVRWLAATVIEPLLGILGATALQAEVAQ